MERKHNYIVLDIETGGFNPEENPITSIAAIVLNTELEEIERFEYFIKPYDNLIITEGALKITGLEVSKLEKEGTDIKTVIGELITLFQRHKIGSYNKPILVGHNASKFDAGGSPNGLKEKKGNFLFHIFSQRGDNLYNYIENFIFDTLYIVKMKVTSDIPNYQLKTVCEYFEVEASDSHSAMNDVEMNVGLFKLLLMQIRSNSSEIILQQKEKSRNSFQF